MLKKDIKVLDGKLVYSYSLTKKQIVIEDSMVEVFGITASKNGYNFCYPDISTSEVFVKAFLEVCVKNMVAPEHIGDILTDVLGNAFAKMGM